MTSYGGPVCNDRECQQGWALGAPILSATGTNHRGQWLLPLTAAQVSGAICWQVASAGSELAGRLISLDTGPVVPLFLSPRIPAAGCPLEPQGQSLASSPASLHIVEAPPQR